MFSDPNHTALSLPVGAIIPYAGPVDNTQSQAAMVPGETGKDLGQNLERQGWLNCDGRALQIARYPELFQAIGYIYGNPSDGNFNLPDYASADTQSWNIPVNFLIKCC